MPFPPYSDFHISKTRNEGCGYKSPVHSPEQASSLHASRHASRGISDFPIRASRWGFGILDLVGTLLEVNFLGDIARRQDTIKLIGQLDGLRHADDEACYGPGNYKKGSAEQ